MNLGIYLDGTKESILANLDRVVKKEVERFDKECREYQFLTGWDMSNPARPLPEHRARPISNKFAAEILRLAGSHFQEQLEDLGDDEPCSVGFQITVHRRNPR